MASRMNEFREFVRKYPLLKETVHNGQNTWQTIYEEWVLYGEDDRWNQYLQRETKKENEQKTNNLSFNGVKKVFDYAKNINPDNLNKTLNNVQKVIQIAQTVSGNKTISAPVNAVSTFSDWWD